MYVGVRRPVRKALKQISALLNEKDSTLNYRIGNLKLTGVQQYLRMDFREPSIGNLKLTTVAEFPMEGQLAKKHVDMKGLQLRACAWFNAICCPRSCCNFVSVRVMR